ncbi:MAG: hypothetical protein QNJ72_42215 [Pleurocapsa sp. MO_226.B13]|nr:hypothetical protein [Pleurocapsa sp. MO_226.B13]
MSFPNAIALRKQNFPKAIALGKLLEQNCDRTCSLTYPCLH